MINIPSEVQELFKSDSVLKNFHVHFPNGEYRDLHNSDVVSESVRFTESLCSQQYLKFGLTEASQIEFECVGVPNIRGVVIQCAIEIDVSSLGDAWIEANTNAAESVLLNESGTALGAENGNAIGGTVYIEDSFLTPQVVHLSDSFIGYRVPYGEFIVDSCPRNHGAMAHRRVTAYGRQIYEDAMQIYGIQKKSSMIINPETYYEAYNTDPANMTDMTRVTSSNQYAIPMEYGYNTAAGTSRYAYFNGIRFAEFSLSISEADANKKILIWTDFPECEYDDPDTAIDLARLVGRAAPSGYLYGRGVKQASTSGRYFSVVTGALRPCVFIRNSANFCYPIFIKPQQKYVIDIRNLVYSWNKTNTQNLLYITVRIPIIWTDTSLAHWIVRNASSGTDISDTAVSGWPISTTYHRVSAVTQEVFAKYQILTDADSNFDMLVENTLETTEPFMGDYYTYANAFSFRELLSGWYELRGIYGKQERDGSYSEQELVAQNPYSITPDMYSELWWEEYDVQPIGTLEYEWDDGTDRQSGSMALSTDGSVYSFADNYVLQHLYQPTETKIRNILQTYFVPKIGGVIFTPIDLDAVGLPFLESGDYVELTAQDGTTVDSYILERSISGIQSLRDSIASTGGEVIA